MNKLKLCVHIGIRPSIILRKQNFNDFKRDCYVCQSFVLREFFYTPIQTCTLNEFYFEICFGGIISICETIFGCLRKIYVKMLSTYDTGQDRLQKSQIDVCLYLKQLISAKPELNCLVTRQIFGLYSLLYLLKRY